MHDSLERLASPAVAILVAATLVLVVFWLSKAKDDRYPPSPPADPIIGHARIMPMDYAWETFAKWARTYGDVIYAHVLGRPMLILNSAVAARDLMEKKSAIYSDRPHFIVLGDLMGWGITLTFLPYGNRFRKQRRMMQQHFNSQAVSSFRPLQANQVHKFLRNLLRMPEDFRTHIHQLTAGSALMATYGHEVTSENDPYVRVVEEATKLSAEAGSPGATSIDLVPFLRHLPSWLPGMSLKRYCERTRVLVNETMALPYNGVKAKRDAGTAQPSFMSHLLDDYECMQTIDPEHEENIKAICALVYSAGVETLVTTTSTFFLMMARNPEVVKRAQEEIDREVGSDRLPTFEDRQNLPYIDCILKEVFRIYPAVPLGIPHQTSEADEYRGLKIPEGSMVLPNIWHMMRDEEFYPDPETFNPDRFFSKGPDQLSKMADDDEGNGIRLGQVAADDPSTMVFGFGRRLCPGRFFADASLWLTVSNFLATFDIRPSTDPVSGKEMIPEMAFVSGTTAPPKPFKCTIVPRSEKHVRLIQLDV